MINLIEEEYDAASGKYVLHLTMGTEDTLSDLPSAEKPFNSSNYSCFFDYGEPAESSSAVDEESGEICLYSNGEWVEPQPVVGAKIPATTNSNIKINGVDADSVNAVSPGDVITADFSFLIDTHYKMQDGALVQVEGVVRESYTVVDDDFYLGDIDEVE